MSIDYFLLKRKLKKEHSYLSIQQELSCYRKAVSKNTLFLAMAVMCATPSTENLSLERCKGRNKSTSDASWLQMHNRCKK